MLNPVSRIRHTIKRSRLNVDILVSRVEVDVPNRRCVARLTILDGDGFEEWRYDEVYILSGSREETHHY